MKGHEVKMLEQYFTSIHERHITGMVID
jgi:hypothetical protein